MTRDPQPPELEREERSNDAVIEAPDVSGVPDQQDGPPPAGYGGTESDETAVEERRERAAPHAD